MKILFIGAVQSSEVFLKALLDSNEEIVGLVTKQSSIFNSDFVNLGEICVPRSIPVFYYSKSNESEMAGWIKRLGPDVIFCFGWSHLLGEEVLRIPAMGTVGFHPSPLPRNRGRHPIVWTLVLGLNETASSFFYIDIGTDEGDLISQKPVRVEGSDTARTLYDRIMRTAVEQLFEFLPVLKEGKVIRKKQDLAQGNVWRKRSDRDSVIDFRMSERGILNLVRALTHPYLGADVVYLDRKFKVWSARRSSEIFPAHVEMGKVLGKSDGELTVKCEDGAVVLFDHELPDRIRVGDYL